MISGNMVMQATERQLDQHDRRRMHKTHIPYKRLNPILQNNYINIKQWKNTMCPSKHLSVLKQKGISIVNIK